MTRKVKVKLTSGEYILPPEVAMRNRARLEAMNAEGLKARNMGGVAAYRANGGAVYGNLGLPKGGVGALGQAITDAAYGRETTAWSDLAKAQAAEKGEADAVDKDIRKLVNEASGLLQGAAMAGDFINGHRQDLSEEEKAEVEEAESGLGERLKEGLTSLVSTAAGAVNATARIREEALAKIAYRKYPDSYRDYVRLKAVANKMVFPILESGALGVNPTDADVELARQSMFDVKAPSTTWAAQLNDLSQRHGGERIIAELAIETGNEQTVEQVAAGQTLVDTSAINVNNAVFSDEEDSYVGQSLIAPLAEPTGNPELDEPETYKRRRRWTFR